MSDTTVNPGHPGTAGDGHETPTRVCPHCATVTHTAGDYCPNCGKSYVRRGRLPKRARLRIAVGLALAILVGGGVAVFLKVHHDEQIEKQHRAAIAAANARQRAQKESEAASERQKTEENESKESERKSDESELEKAVGKDAKKLVAEGTLSEPILGVSCTPVSGGSSSELVGTTGTYSCLAITKREANGESSGYAFSGTIDFAGGSFTYHLGR